MAALWVVALLCAAPAFADTEIDQASLTAALSEPEPPIVIDARTPEEFAAGHVPGAINIPHDQIDQQLSKLLPYSNSDIIVYCKSGRRAGLAAAILRENSFENVRLLEGHMEGWKAAALPVEQGN